MSLVLKVPSVQGFHAISFITHKRVLLSHIVGECSPVDRKSSMAYLDVRYQTATMCELRTLPKISNGHFKKYSHKAWSWSYCCYLKRILNWYNTMCNKFMSMCVCLLLCVHACMRLCVQRACACSVVACARIRDTRAHLRLYVYTCVCRSSICTKFVQ